MNAGSPGAPGARWGSYVNRTVCRFPSPSSSDVAMEPTALAWSDLYTCGASGAMRREDSDARGKQGNTPECGLCPCEDSHVVVSRVTRVAVRPEVNLHSHCPARQARVAQPAAWQPQGRAARRALQHQGQAVAQAADAGVRHVVHHPAGAGHLARLVQHRPERELTGEAVLHQLRRRVPVGGVSEQGRGWKQGPCLGEGRGSAPHSAGGAAGGWCQSQRGCCPVGCAHQGQGGGVRNASSTATEARKPKVRKHDRSVQGGEQSEAKLLGSPHPPQPNTQAVCARLLTALRLGKACIDGGC